MGSTWRVGILPIAQLLLLVASCSAGPDYRCFFFSNNIPATIVPIGNIDREVGSSYEAYCLFDPDSINVDNVFFVHWGDTPDDQYRIDHEVVNNSAIRVSVQHDKMTDYSLKCMMEDQEKPAEFTDNVHLCSRKVNFGYPPQDVQNITCISRNWEKLNCSWVEPPNPISVKYTLTYVVVGFRDTSLCPKNENKTCVWQSTDFAQRDKWILTFTASNKLQSDVSFNHNISVYENVIPNPAEDLTVHAEGPHSVKLTWKLPHPIDVFPGNVTQEVSYREHPDGNEEENLEWILADDYDLVAPPLFNKVSYNKTIEGLYAYMRYDFRVRLHTGVGEIRKHMWSDAAVTTIRTNPKKPTAIPATDLGTFEVEQNVNVRDIYVYWQMVDPIFWNGPNFRYDVAVYNADTSRKLIKESRTKEMHDREGYAKFPNMDNDVNYRFEIWPVNEIGPGGEETKSVVNVPKKRAVLDYPTHFKVIAYSEANSTIYSVRWNIPEEKIKSQKIETVTIYWCKKKNYEERCKNKLEWMTVRDPEISKKNVTDFFEYTTTYLFGISVNSNTSSSGIKWITCIASHGQRPPPIDSFDGREVSSTEIELEWNLDCQAKAAEPIGYNISYCISQGDSADCMKDAVITYIEVDDADILTWSVKNLRPYTKYIFNIASQTEVGPSRWGKSIQLQTLQAKPSGPSHDLKARVKGQEWVLLSWEPPALSERNGIIVEYKIVSEPFVNIPNQLANKTSDVTYANITGLEPYNKYNFHVFACTKGALCSDIAASYELRTEIGVPGMVEAICMNAYTVQWNHDDCNGPKCSYEIRYDNNSSITEPDQMAINIEELGINCTAEYNEKFSVEIRALSTQNEFGQQLKGPWKMQTITCPQPELPMPWWLILVIATVCIIATAILVAVCSFGRSKVKEFLLEWNREIELPSGLGPRSPVHEDNHSSYTMVHNHIDDWTSNDIIPTKKTPFPNPEEQELIPDKARQSRNPSGDSGTSENDPVDSSGCSTGSESDSSSGSHRVPQSSDSGTGTELGFPPESKNWESGSLRQRTPVPPYVRPGLPQNMTSAGYVSLGSVPNLPNLPVGSIEDGLSLQQSTSSLAMGMSSQQPLGTRRASTGYISMPDQDAEAVNLPLEMLGNVTLPHDRPGGFPAYSRHSFLPKKSPTVENSPYIKTGSLQRLNTGYVAVAQPDGGPREMLPQARGFLGDEQFGDMKRQSSLSAIPLSNNKSISTPDEDLPPGTYCRVGARGSPSPPSGPSPGYVSITQAMPANLIPPSVTTTSPTHVSPYVPYDMAKSMPSPPLGPEKGSGGYVSVGNMAEGRWAHPVISTEDFEDGREVSSAPLEGTRSRPLVPTRPNTSEATINHNRGQSRFNPLAPSLSKQSSGYVSQDSLPIHDPVVMSPKRLLTQSKDPYSMIMPPDHKGTAV